jgi:glycogen operon protein
VVDDSFYLIFNAYHEPLTFKLPAQKHGKQWLKVVDTSSAFVGESEHTNEAETEIKVKARSMEVFRRVE